MAKGDSEGKVPAPYPLAMIVCDAFHRDPGTGKMFILGCFSVVHAREFPATHPVMCLYVAITDGRGRIPIKVCLVDADEEQEPIWEIEQEVVFEDPRMVMELGFMLGGVTFPQPGEYRFQLFASNDFVMERRVIANLVEVQEDDSGNN